MSPSDAGTADMSVIVLITNVSQYAGTLRRLCDLKVVGAKPAFTEHLLNSALGISNQIALVVIAEDVDDDEALDLADTVSNHRSDVPIVLVRERAEPLSDAHRAVGVVDLIEVTAPDLEVERLLTRHTAGGSAPPVDAVAATDVAADSGRHRVIVVLSPKGGVGKTTISTNLAIAMSRRASLDTVIVDFDAPFGDVANVLNVTAPQCIEDAFTQDSVQSRAVVIGLLDRFDDRLLVLAGSDSPDALEKVTPAQESALIRQLSDDYSFVIIDTGSGLTDETLAALEVATDVVLVTTLDVSSVKALRRSVELLDRIDLLPTRRHLVVNMTEPGTGLELDDVTAVMQMPVAVSVARSVDVALSVNTGRPLAQANPSAPLSAAMETLGGLLRGDESARRGGGILRRAR